MYGTGVMYGSVAWPEWTPAPLPPYSEAKIRSGHCTDLEETTGTALGANSSDLHIRDSVFKP